MKARSFSILAVRDGQQIRPLDPRAFARAVAGFGQGEEFEVLLRDGDKVQRRSREANNYLWGHVYELMAEATGETVEDIHDAMCAKFLPSEAKRVSFYNATTGQRLEVETDARRSSKLSTSAFYDFVERVRQFAAEFLGVATRDPDPEWWRKGKAA